MELSYLAFLATSEGSQFETQSHATGERYIGKDKMCAYFCATEDVSEDAFIFVDRNTLMGITRKWHPSGKDKAVLQTKDKIKHGTETQYYENGTMLGQISFVDGVPHGPYVTYFPSGKMYLCARYHHGKLMGSYQRYNEDGSLAETRFYTDESGLSCGAF